ncbi:hypothetical protein EV192_107211 [Actinocrispum wychmicini]|uniref:Uncharacterized protein n=1 Tax=Actinocrispum wychmicini TaxID=1213861 RepID=A0A4R2JFZ4_9PSEU|nr:hypothetical protein EV192_107211 [Actinocrispum wychmicini]
MAKHRLDPDNATAQWSAGTLVPASTPTSTHQTCDALVRFPPEPEPQHPTE